jgi:polysaccharide export outer membrane protein
MTFTATIRVISFKVIGTTLKSQSFRRNVFPILSLGMLVLLAPAMSVKVAGQNTQPAAISRVAGSTNPADDTRYRIGAGDVLSILVRKAPELSGSVRVDQRGMIRIPMIEGDVMAACRTESELAAQIATLYLEFKQNPNVDVFVQEFQSRPVALIGAVNAPGQFRLQRQVRLLELLTYSGGPAGRAGRIINIIHAAGPNICQTEAADSNNPAPVKELSVYKLNDTLKGIEGANPFVQPGDIVALPEADQVFIIGHVVAPQAIPLRDKPITISRAIAMSGGPARDAATGKIRIVRQVGDSGIKQEIFVDLKAVLKQKAEDIALIPNDIVEVPSSSGKVILGALTGAIAPTLSQLPVRMIP